MVTIGSSAWTAGVKAHAVLKRAAPLVPHDAALRLLGADTCYRNGWVSHTTLSHATRVVKRAAPLVPHDAALWFLGADTCYTNGWVSHRTLSHATRVVKKAAPLVPHDAALRLLGADTCYRNGWVSHTTLSDATRVVKKAALLVPHDAALRLLGADTCYRNGWVSHTTLSHATRVVKRAAPLVPHDAALRLLGADTCYRNGWVSHTTLSHATRVVKRAAPLVPHDAALRLLGADTCFRNGWIEDGLELAEQALAIEEERNGPLIARCCLYTGIGYQMSAQKTNSRVDKDAANDKCLKLLLRSVTLDDNDHLAFYHLALAYMQQGRLNDAMDATRACLAAAAESSGGLRLATVLWSAAAAGPRGARALAAARLARARYPEALWPLWALAALQLVWESGEVRGETARAPGPRGVVHALFKRQASLATGKELLTLLNSAEAEAEAEAERHGYAELDALSDSGHTDLQSVTHAPSGRTESAGAYRVERALSEGASSASGARQRARAPLAQPRAQAWLLLADLCLRLGRVAAAAGCVAEAATLTPHSHLVLYTRGMVHETSGEWEEARQCFQNALALHPTHLDSIVHLGAAYYNLGWLRLAEKTLREAVALEPARADTWRRLALVLAALGDPAAAADTAAAALALHPLAHLPL
ncbi:hypothetical protein MSG28_009957 [Choristoneura fumiferana]|uniref:Uncharacterized protein n=1 Tax=Choristoneura fumiferana TaxID=7141 RepID=A0ACC0JD49_CHOFU|nr:hypothetical protein MSG28_009957 [Choristoneura fumiferana]